MGIGGSYILESPLSLSVFFNLFYGVVLLYYVILYIYIYIFAVWRSYVLGSVFARASAHGVMGLRKARTSAFESARLALSLLSTTTSTLLYSPSVSLSHLRC